MSDCLATAAEVAKEPTDAGFEFGSGAADVVRCANGLFSMETTIVVTGGGMHEGAARSETDNRKFVQIGPDVSYTAQDVLDLFAD